MLKSPAISRDEINAAIDYAENKVKLDSLGQQLESSAK
jgi:hypothetical protein